MSARVSVIVPCYNQHQFLGEALNSVFAQTFKEWECIIINDGSTDSTEDVVKPFLNSDNRFKYLKIENSGPSVARNMGISIAKGEFILPLDGDDKISNSYIEKCSETLKENRQVKLVYGIAEKFGEVNNFWNLPEFEFEKMLFSNSIHCCGMFKKMDWESVGGYDNKMRDGLEDWEFWINLLKDRGKVVNRNDITFFWRIRPGSRTNRISDKQKKKLLQYIYLKHFNLYENFFIDPIGQYEELSRLTQKIEAIDRMPLKYAVKKMMDKFK